MRIKVCGMTIPEQVNQLGDLGVDFAGFIFYPKSPRYVFKNMTTIELKRIRNINKIGVFVNTPIDEVLAIVDECNLHMVQLHGDESPKYCEKLADYISVIKAFRLSENDNIEWMTRPYLDVSDMYMFDTIGAGYGGTGKKFNWNLLNGVTVGKSFFLSGGIEPGDENNLREFIKQPVAKDLFAIDINSRFELSPGVKQIEMIKCFVEELKDSSLQF